MQRYLTLLVVLALGIPALAREPIEEQRVRYECIVRAELFSAIVQARNLGVHRPELEVRIRQQLSQSRIGSMQVALLHPIAEKWTAKVIRAAYAAPRHLEEVQTYDALDDFKNTCLDNPERYTRPGIIDWESVIRDQEK